MLVLVAVAVVFLTRFWKHRKAEGEASALARADLRKGLKAGKWALVVGVLFLLRCEVEGTCHYRRAAQLFFTNAFEAVSADYGAILNETTNKIIWFIVFIGAVMGPRFLSHRYPSKSRTSEESKKQKEIFFERIEKKVCAYLEFSPPSNQHKDGILVWFFKEIIKCVIIILWILVSTIIVFIALTIFLGAFTIPFIF